MTKIVKGTLSVLQSISGAHVLYGQDADSGERIPLGSVNGRVPNEQLSKIGGGQKYDPNADFLLLDDFDFEVVRS
jgi:hypothetical protein